MAKTLKRKVAKRGNMKKPSRRESLLQRNNDRLTLELGATKRHADQLSHTVENLASQNAAFRNLGFCMRGPDWPFLDFEKMVKMLTKEELDILLDTIKKRTEPAAVEYAIAV